MYTHTLSIFGHSEDPTSSMHAHVHNKVLLFLVMFSIPTFEDLPIQFDLSLDLSYQRFENDFHS